MTSKTEKLQKSFAKAGTVLTAGLTVPIAGLIGAGVKYNMQIENFSASLTTLLGSADKAQKMLADLQEMASKTPFETTQLLESTQMMLAFGIQADKTKGYLQVLGDISMGDAEKLSALTRAFGQMSSSGKASMEDINQMIDQGFNPLQYISEKTGETMVSLKDRVSKGSVSFEEIAGAMKYATEEGKPFFKSMDKASETTTGKISTLKDEFGKASGKLTEDLLPAMTDLVDKFSFLATKFNELSPEKQQQILNAFLGLAVLGPVLLIINGLITAFGTAWTVLGGLASGVQAFGTTMLALGGTIGSVLASIGGGVAAIGGIFVAGIALIVAGIGFAIWYALSNWEAFKLGLVTILKFIGNFIITTFYNIGNVIVGVGKNIVNIFTGTFNFIMSILNSMGNFISSVFWNVGSSIVGIAGWIINSFNNAFNSVVNGVRWLWNTLSGFVNSIAISIGNAIWGTIRGVVNGILWLAENTINGFIRGLNNVVGLINKVPGVNIGYINTLNIPRLATGTNNVEREGLAYLHSGEAVVPKKYNPAVGGFGNNSSETIEINNVMTLDGKVVYENQQTIGRNKTLQMGFGG